MKRKPDTILGAAQQFKRGRHADTDSGDTFDIDGSAQGAKHWTDEEKTRLFTWLMGQGQDEHWSSLRATKNSCLREVCDLFIYIATYCITSTQCAIEVFGNKKTYQALKGCYERNFNLFKQIYAFENFHAHSTNVVISGLSEPDRLREYERRLQTARKSGCDVGNINARTIDHWHRIGWYDLFFRRFVFTSTEFQLDFLITSHHVTIDGKATQRPPSPRSPETPPPLQTRVGVVGAAVEAMTAMTMTRNSTSPILSHWTPDLVLWAKVRTAPTPSRSLPSNKLPVSPSPQYHLGWAQAWGGMELESVEQARRRRRSPPRMVIRQW